MNAILSAGPDMRFPTDMLAVLRALGDRRHELDWIVSGFETWPSGEQPKWLDEPIAVFADDALEEFARDRVNQWIWGVFSGVPRGSARRLAPTACALLADHTVFRSAARPRHPDAVVEVVAWDSSLTLFISTDEDLVARFRTAFPGATDLDAYVAALAELPPHA